MGCGESKGPKLDSETKKCMDILEKRPNLKQYKCNAKNLATIEKAYDSPVFGGSVFDPIGANKTVKSLTKPNNLKEDM